MLLLDTRHAAPARHAEQVETTLSSRYVDPMAATANQVAAALRDHLTDLDGPQLHRLLYYVQGHHLALFGRPAFTEILIAGPDGPEVDAFHDQHLDHVRGVLDQPLLNTVLIVAARYGRLTSGDLDRLTRAETPWQSTALKQPIAHTLLDVFFSTDGAAESFDDPEGDDPAWQRRVAEEVTRIQAAPPAGPDSLDDLLAKVAGRGRR